MKKSALFIGALSLAAAGGFAQSNGRTFTGEIMDSNCAKMGSHAAMEKQHNIPDGKTCTNGCVKGGAKYVLYNPETMKTYALDDQTKPETYAGQKVNVNGTLNKAGNTIHVESISSAS